VSRLYASIDSDSRRTLATSRGHRRIDTHTRGWDSGVRVVAYVDADDHDVIDVYQTAGSNGSASERLIARIVDGYLWTYVLDVATGKESQRLAVA
jgi:hypothetical protein